MPNHHLQYKGMTCEYGHKTWVLKSEVQGRVPMGDNRMRADCQRCLEMKNEGVDKALLAKNCSEAPSWMIRKSLTHD